ncbi:hypothetical protein J1N35_005363 [Gossypium stocksii]|uniref:Uncharacterized protein n=1 Tax=Gossypium stocksii TaxID=47602 RepID=A0A9D3WEE1_9ROSI|nr:hypothetical protein J1N35_005363 [Gossypium stocksii]
MDSEGTQSLPTLGSDNSELGTEALAELVRKMVEEVLKTKVKEIRETLQAGCLECKKKDDPSSGRTEPCSVKHVKWLGALGSRRRSWASILTVRSIEEAVAQWPVALEGAWKSRVRAAVRSKGFLFAARVGRAFEMDRNSS